MEISLHPWGEQRGAGGEDAKGADLGGSEGADISLEFCLF